MRAALARPRRCSTRDAGGWPAAPTWWWPRIGSTAILTTRCAGWRCSGSPGTDPLSWPWTSRRCWHATLRSCASTTSPRDRQDGKAATRDRSRVCWRPGSRCWRRSTCFRSRARPPRSHRCWAKLARCSSMTKPSRPSTSWSWSTSHRPTCCYRLREQHVLAPSALALALQRDLRLGALEALRESAFRVIADHADRQLVGFMRENRVEVPWEVRGRIVLCIPVQKGLEDRIRRTARIRGGAGREVLGGLGADAQPEPARRRSGWAATRR